MLVDADIDTFADWCRSGPTSNVLYSGQARPSHKMSQRQEGYAETKLSSIILTQLAFIVAAIGRYHSLYAAMQTSANFTLVVTRRSTRNTRFQIGPRAFLRAAPVAHSSFKLGLNPFFLPMLAASACWLVEAVSSEA